MGLDIVFSSDIMRHSRESFAGFKNSDTHVKVFRRNRVTPDFDIGMSTFVNEENMIEPKETIGKECAIKLFDSKWWENKTYKEIAEFQLFISELCCPFDIFHEAMEKSLNRPIWTHEFGLGYPALVSEFLGEKEPPTLQSIIELIPEDKRVLIKYEPVN